ncbi:dual specificity phosphatase, catalytic domain containing protein [Acanthamoeba castellanii str. Neff]|uniref:protein-tyrosine-phosphatase n=1 Tax=Acanthamoeba castellanii (strain ATCC 30010 / Neff) TaxID=1257118 RepID=L8H3C9_ACACF|nr:dual specificity phosphatase, catalytic domain containing protein [Acanthamoeba castellanii str. Neff]ELR19218.1 dual specificity phosphatase, catalytic domain containing protein [Acanthamoeba castellanii str. Neff]
MREKLKLKCTIQDLVRPSPVSYIVPNLFLGDKHIAGDQAELQRLNVTHIVNCAKGLPDSFSPPATPRTTPTSLRPRSRSPSPSPRASSTTSDSSCSSSCSSSSSSSDEEMREVDEADFREDVEEEEEVGDNEEEASSSADMAAPQGSWGPAYHRCELLDSSRAEGEFEQALAATFAFIDAALAAERGKGGAVLIHCCAGRSRGPAVMTAYLIHRYRWSLDKAYTFVCQARPVVCPNRGFLSALLKLEKRLLGANSMTLRHNGHHHTLAPLRGAGKKQQLSALC